MDLIERLRARAKQHGGDWLLNEAAAALEAAREDAWQPIETAPRGGREMILLLTPSRFPQVAFSNTWWTAGFSVECKPTHWRRIEPLPAIDQARGKGDPTQEQRAALDELVREGQARGEYDPTVGEGRE